MTVFSLGKYSQNPDSELLDTSAKFLIPNVPINVTVDGKLYTFKAGDPMQRIDTIIFFASGDTSAYPFDECESSLSFKGLIPLVSSSVEIEAKSPEGDAPIGYLTASALQLFNFRSEVLEGDGSVFAVYTVTRSVTTRIFCVFVVIMMWLLSLNVFYLSVSIWVRKRRVEPPTIAVSGALLFGLPALRNVQPAAPPIGTTADVFGFFWNMMLVSLSGILLFC